MGNLQPALSWLGADRRWKTCFSAPLLRWKPFSVIPSLPCCFCYLNRVIQPFIPAVTNQWNSASESQGNPPSPITTEFLSIWKNLKEPTEILVLNNVESLPPPVVNISECLCISGPGKLALAGATVCRAVVQSIHHRRRPGRHRDTTVHFN